MKKLLLLLLIVCSLFAEIDERKIDVYFANGIDTSVRRAKEAKDKISEKYQTYNPTLYKSVEDWKVAYNTTHGIGLDLYESTIQKVYEDPVGKSLVPFLWNLPTIAGMFDIGISNIVGDIAKKVARHSVKQYASTAATRLARRAARVYNNRYGHHLTEAELELLFDEVLDHLIEEGTQSFINTTEAEILQQQQDDLLLQYNNYQQSIWKGHGVVVISHSQGNFFTNGAYEMFDSALPILRSLWMRNYFKTLGVATPADNVLGNGDPYITFDNDIIQLVPWSLPPNVPNPRRYYIENALGEQIGESNFSIKAHNFLSSYMATPSTRAAILGFIESGIIDHKNAPSQWQKSADINTPSCANPNVCKQRIRVKHIKDASLTDQMKDEEVYEFNPSGKLYPVGGKYVKASEGGTDIDDVYASSGETVCYELNGTSEKIHPAGNANWPQPVDGEVTVALRWDTTNIDMDLDVSGPSQGDLDIHDDASCPLEHYNIQAPNISTGLHPVHVTNKGNVNLTDLPQIIVVDVATPKKSGLYGLEISDPAGLNLGHVADILISEKEHNITIPPTVRTIFSITQDVNGSSPVFSDYIYEIISRLPQLVYGPIAGASIDLYTFDGYGSDAPIFSGTTSEGNSVYTAGIISIPKNVLDSLEDGSLYIFSAQGGKDIDANDDTQPDWNPTPNYGTMHGILSGKALKGTFKVNVLTEMAYQIVSPMIGSQDEEGVKSKLDEIAGLLLKQDVNGDALVDREDLSYWIPSVDKSKLKFAYNRIEPIVQKLYLGERIYEDVLDLLYPNAAPIADAGEDFNVTYGDPILVDGSESYDLDGYIVDYTWKEGDTLFCKGEDPLCMLPQLPVGPHSVKLIVTDERNTTRSDTLNINVLAGDSIDPALLACVDLMLQLPDGTIPTEDQMLSITNLHCNAYPIGDLSWLSNFSNLTRITFIGNNITDISPLATLIKLEQLEIADNPLGDIAPLGELTNITYLYLDNIAAKDFSALERMKGLQTIYLANVQIDNTLPLETLPALEGINVEYTNLADLTIFSKMTNAFYIYASDNELTSLDGVEGLSNLQYLYTPRNKIKDIGAISTLTQLLEFEALANNISDLTALQSLTNLNYLVLESNKISDLSPLRNLLKLEYLYLKYNCITDFSPVSHVPYVYGSEQGECIP